MTATEFYSAFAPVVADLAKVFREAARAIFFALRTALCFLLPYRAAVRRQRAIVLRHYRRARQLRALK